ncbi:MAG: glycosyltransferase family 4 protein [Rhodanobacter sp.]
MHVAQINFVPAPEGLAPAEVLEQWPSLVDIAEMVAACAIRVSVIQASTRTGRLTRNGIDYHFIDMSAMDSAASRCRRLASALDDIKVDVLHVHGLEFAATAAVLSRCLPHLPMILQDHANHPPRWWRRPQWRRWYAAASGIAFTARDLAQPFTSAGLFDPRTSLFEIPESSSRFMPGNRGNARVETGLYGSPCVLWVGHLSHRKDPLTVLNGVARASLRLPGLQLWCAFGSSPLMVEVRRRIARDPQLAGCVHLLGRVAHPRVERLMQAADLFVSGSLAEGSGYALLEALACGLAPVVTNIPSFRALTGGGLVGRLWPAGDSARLAEALVSAATDPPSPAWVRAHFDAVLSFAAVGNQWARVYAQVLDDRGAR